MVEPAYSPVDTDEGNDATYSDSPNIIWISTPPRLRSEQPIRSSRWKRCVIYTIILSVTACLVHVYDDWSMNKRLSATATLTTRKPMTDPYPSAPWPRIAWLMSFPNSGTTFTIHLIGNITNTTTATNYGLESTNQSGIPVHLSSPNGPFIAMPHLPLPETYVLTKTHCGGRCTECSPNTYTETVHSFERMCRFGSKLVNGEKVQLVYNDTVERAIHVIRSPFDNLVARYHLERKAMSKVPKYKEVVDKILTDSKQGLTEWCKYLDQLHTKDEVNSHFFDQDLLVDLNQAPCHAEIYRYIQWHNLAFEVTRRKRLPTYLLYYENYSTQFSKTVTELTTFLQVKAVATAPEFIPGKHYSDYFEEDQCRAITNLARELASPETWQALHQYFDPWIK